MSNYRQMLQLVRRQQEVRNAELPGSNAEFEPYIHLKIPVI